MKSEKQSLSVCCNSRDAEQFWRESFKQSGFDTKDEGVFVITLDNERRFTGCHQITSKVFRSAVLFADEVVNAAYLQGIEEFIVLHNRPGISPEVGKEDKERAREIARAAQRKNFALLDYVIIGSSDERFPLGNFSCHKRLAKWMGGKKL